MTATEHLPSLSVVIPVYNEEATIDQILTAVSAQNLVTEIVIVDDCSKDNSAEKIKQAADRLCSERSDLKVTFLQNEKKSGQGQFSKERFPARHRRCTRDPGRGPGI